jgi:hypothetical protein
MKTAMQELIDYANELDFGGWEDVFIQKATELLEKEKEQIIAAGNFLPHDEQNEIKTPEDYYNQTYNN